MLGALDGILLGTHTQHASNAVLPPVPGTVQKLSGSANSSIKAQPKPNSSLNSQSASFWHSVIVGVAATVGFTDIDGLTDGYTLVKVDPPQRQQA